MMNFIQPLLPKVTKSGWWYGVLLVGVIAFFSEYLSSLPSIAKMGLSALTLAIVIGMVLGNTIFPKIADQTAMGVDYSKGVLLRAGIILYGFRISFQQIIGVGWSGIIIDALVVFSVFTFAYWAGPRLFKLDKTSSILIGAGAAICGAAAVMATEPVIRAPAHKVTIAVATVVVFGTISMFLYPFLYSASYFTESEFGIFIGSTIHEVAQVVAAGKAVSETTAESAIIVKMMRVMLLVPFLIILSAFLAKGDNQEEGESKKTSITIPWFAIFFIVASGINSLHILSTELTNLLVHISTILLSMAMAALGLRTHMSTIKEAGVKPLMLAGVLFVFLIVGGLGINKFVHLFVH